MHRECYGSGMTNPTRNLAALAAGRQPADLDAYFHAAAALIRDMRHNAEIIWIALRGVDDTDASAASIRAAMRALAVSFDECERAAAPEPVRRTRAA